MRVLVWSSTLTVVVSAFSFSFPTVSQCGPLSLDFPSKPQAEDLPLTLNVLPFNSTSPLQIPIPNAAITTGGATINFLPFPAGTSFIAAIDGADNSTEGSASSVEQIQPSTSNNASCLTTNPTTPLLYTLPDSDFVQCQPFNVSYNDTLIAQPPSIRAFATRGSSTSISMVDQPANGIATYLMTVQQGIDVVLLLDDLQGHRQTSVLITIGRNSSSSTNCMPVNLHESSSSKPNPSKLSKHAIAAIAASSTGVVTIVLVLALITVFRDQRKRRVFIFRQSLTRVRDEVGSTPPPRPSRRAIPSLFTIPDTKTPLYTSPGVLSEKFSSPPSFNYVMHPDENTGARQAPSAKISLERNGSSVSNVKNNRGPFNDSRPPSQASSLDIEGLLNAATFYQDQSSSVDNPPDLPPPPQVYLAPPRNYETNNGAPPSSSTSSTPIRIPRLKHLRLPSDVPADPPSQPQSLSILPSPTFLVSDTQDSSRLLVPQGVKASERLSYESTMSDASVFRGRPPVSPQMYRAVPPVSFRGKDTLDVPPIVTPTTADSPIDSSWYGIAR